MTIFWILAAGLTGLALLFVVPPLVQARATDAAPSQDALNLALFRDRLAELDGDLAAGLLDRARYEAARRDLERELLHDLHDGTPAAATGAPVPRADTGPAPLLALVLALAVPTAALLGYLRLGDPEIIPRLETAGGVPTAPATGTQATASLEVLAQGLAERMEKTPDNLDGWLMLGRTYLTIEQPDKALKALERAYRLAPEQPDALVAYAEVLAVNAGNDLKGRPAELIRTALRLEPGHEGARWLSGTLAYQQGRFAEAAETWQGLSGTLDPAGEDARQLGAMIAAARAKAGTAGPDTPAPGAASPPAGPDGARPLAGEGAPPPAVVAAPAPAGEPQAAAASGAQSASGASVQVSVSLAPALAAQAAPEDTVFVFARTPTGPPMPLAVKRLKVRDLPATLTLDDSAALIPTLRLSGAPEVLVGARVSRRGEATPGSGDLEGEAGPIRVSGSAPVAITIERVRP